MKEEKIVQIRDDFYIRTVNKKCMEQKKYRYYGITGELKHKLYCMK